MMKKRTASYFLARQSFRVFSFISAAMIRQAADRYLLLRIFL